MTVFFNARRGLAALLVSCACLIGQAAIAQTFTDANWEAFGALDAGSPNNQVRAMAEYQGDLYIGGTFADVGGQGVYYVARWNGYQWEKLDQGVNSAVYAMTVHDGKLIVAGSFTTADRVNALRIASWDGQQWAALGDGLNSSVVDLSVYNGDLIAAGIFTAAGGQPVKRLARWDGSQWHGMGGPDHGTVNSLTVYNGELVVAGSFYLVNGENYNYIARWNGASWSGFGDGMNTTVNDVAEFQGKLYATGQFTFAGGTAANYLAVWDGATWSPVTGGLADPGYSLYADNDRLYVGGQFATAGGVSSLGIAAWDGSQWSAVGDGLELYAGSVIRIYRMTKFNDEIVLGGLLAKGNLQNLVRLNGDGQWQNLSSSFVDGPIRAVHRHGENLIVAGEFTRVSGVPANRIARWDGNQWHALGEGFNGPVLALDTFNDELYAGGDFSEADGQPAAGVARWDGERWQPLGSGVNGTVRTFKVWRDRLYMGGDFSQAGGAPSTLLAAWSGGGWVDVGVAELSGELHDMEVHQDILFLAGDMRFLGNDLNLIAFPGTGGYAAFPGIPEVDKFTALTLHQGNLIVFASDTVTAASQAYVFTGTGWADPLPEIATPTVSSTIEFKNLLFAAADTGLYVYNGDSWQRPAPGITATVNDLAIGGDHLYVGGGFDAVGEQAAQNLAILTPDIGVTFDSQTGQINTALYFAGTTVALPAAPTREGHIFTGWNTQADGSGSGYTDTLTVGDAAVTLYAQWRVNAYTITFDTNGGDELDDLTLAPDAPINAPTPVRAGHTFTGWQPSLPATMPEHDLAVTAQWDRNNYTASFNVNGVVTPVNVPYGDPITPPPAPSRVGYTFTGWSPAIPETMPLDGFSTTAQWQVNQYSIAFDSNGGSAIGTLTQDYGSAVSAPTAPTREGYTFNGWSPAVPATVPAQNLTLTAQWQVNQYTLTFDSNGGTALDAITQDYGSTVIEPTAPTREGYTFSGWSPAVPATVPANNLTVTAQWSINQYTLSFDSAGGTPVASVTQNYGTAVIAPTPPQRAFHTFQGWSPALPATMPGKDLVLTAVWEEFALRTANVIVQGNGQATPASQTLYETQSAEFALTLDDADDYVVVSGCGAGLAGGVITTAPLTGDCTVRVEIYPSTEAEKDKEGPLTSAESVSFRLQGGAGDKTLSSVYRMRAGVDAPLFGDEADTLLTFNEDGSYTFTAERTGRYTFFFSDQVSGEITEVTIEVLPYLAFASSHRRALRDDTSGLTVWLNDEPIEYPVTATLTGSGMGFETRAVTLVESDARRLSLSVPTGGGNTAALELSELGGALAGNPVNQALTLQSEPLPLALTLNVAQGAASGTRVVGRYDGAVTVTADAGVTLIDQYDWQAPALTLSTSGNQASFDPQTLEPGAYEIALKATNANTGGDALLTLQVVNACPMTGCGGLMQGLPDADNTHASERHRLALCPGSRVALCDGGAGEYLETANAFLLTLGGTSGSQSWASGEFGLGVSDGSLPRDGAYQALGVTADFEIQALNQPGETVPVAIPLVGETVIPANAVWRKYLDGGWRLFQEDELNQLHSAPKNPLGRCPAVSADSWTAGLTEGNACVRLSIQDGGPNDADGRMDGVIRDPGTLAVKRSAQSDIKTPKLENGGAAGLLMVGVLGLLALRRRRAGR